MNTKTRFFIEDLMALRLCHRISPILLIALLSLVCGTLAHGATTFTVLVGPSGTFTFSPSTQTIQVGDTIQWTASTAGHTTTSGSCSGATCTDDGLWDSGTLSKNQNFSHTFLTAGSFPYFCSPHGGCCGMQGLIIVTAAPTPTPTPTVSPSPSPSPSPSASPSPSPTPTPVPTVTSLGNISTRLAVQTGDNVMIGGFIVTGTQSKKVILRAIGPSLTANGMPLPGRLGNPLLQLFGPDGLIATNDNWQDTQAAEITATGVAPTDPLESAIVATLPANATGYTAVVSGVGNTTGIALVEAFDLDTTVDSKLANISTRGFVQTGDNVMIGGFIVLGPDPEEVLVRAIGPSLANANPPVENALANPTLSLRNGNGDVVASNDDWRSDQEAEIIATGVAPTNDLESALTTTLSSSVTGIGYTAIVSGVNGGTGVGLVEVYAISP